MKILLLLFGTLMILSGILTIFSGMSRLRGKELIEVATVQNPQHGVKKGDVFIYAGRTWTVYVVNDTHFLSSDNIQKIVIQLKDKDSSEIEWKS